jgi:uncharacterized membrane protein
MTQQFLMLGLTLICVGFAASLLVQILKFTTSTFITMGIIPSILGIGLTLYASFFNPALILAGYGIFGIGFRATLKGLDSRIKDKNVVNRICILGTIIFLIIAALYVFQFFSILVTSTSK